MDLNRTMSPAAGSGKAFRVFSNKQTLSPLDAIFVGSNKSNRTMNSVIRLSSVRTQSNLPTINYRLSLLR